jgi:MFS family permease
VVKLLIVVQASRVQFSLGTQTQSARKGVFCYNHHMNIKIFPTHTVNRTVKILLIFLFSVNTASAMWVPLFSVFANKHIIGASFGVLGILGSVYSITKSVLQVFIAKHLDARAGEKDDYIALFSGICLAAVASFSLIGVKTVLGLGSLQVLWGVADALTMAAYYAIFSHHIDKKTAAFEWSLFSVGGVTTAGAVGGLFGGFLADAYGFSIIFSIAGVINVLSLVLLVALYPSIKVMRAKVG